MNAEQQKFYNLFWNDSVCREIFSKHKSQVLEGDVDLLFSKEKSYSKRIVLTNKVEGEINELMSSRHENESIELLHDLREAVKKYLDEDKIMDFIQERFGEQFNLVVSEIGRHQDKESDDGLVADVISSLFDDEGFLDVLKSYRLIPENIESMDGFLNYSFDKAKAIIRQFIEKENLFDLSLTIDLANVYYNNRTKRDLLGSVKHYTDTYYDTENYSSRLVLFDKLFEMKIISGGQLRGYYECVNCEPDTYNAFTISNLKPSYLAMVCPKCKNDLLYVVPYSLENSVYEDITSTDGLLLNAITYILDKYGFEFEVDVNYLEDIQLDIVIKNEDRVSSIIEVKMFKTDRPFDTQVSNIRQSIGQIKKFVNKLVTIDEGYKSISKHLVTNISDESILSKAKDDLSTDMDEYKVFVWSPEEFHKMVLEHSR